MSNSSKILVSMLLVIVIALAFGGGFFFGQSSRPPMPAGMKVINEAWNDIATNYVDPSKINTANMTGSAIDGSSPHSTTAMTPTSARPSTMSSRAISRVSSMASGRP